MMQIIRGGSLQEQTVLRSMYEARKRVFIDLLRWDIPVLAGRYEIDQFDGPSTIYLIAAERDGTHLGSMRLLPTSGPNLLGDIFPELCDLAPPASTTIWEISRFCLSRDLRAAERRQVRDHLVTMAASFALEEGIESYCCVADMPWFSQILSFGWECRPLGLPRTLACGMLGAMQIIISEDTPALMQAAGVWRPAPAQFAAVAAA
ncbi:MULTISPECIES: acyl-homoserine-lactone synthase [unclassified Sphingobium]|uniref:acyl-homoserine-lactone synthase n=1 Tax=unclassified Sphingobium TaxID=2611147 RepID=UPI000BB52FFE|nr:MULTISPECIES: acyl-homoserine-lactone synthase [unclassified Sphingobium]MDT7531958.1 autoinducer synthase [Sphingobium sp. SA2]PBN41755.1 autoinducer synthase [Sphingobium sp. D43FB]